MKAATEAATSGDDLAPLDTSELTIHEAAPDPAPGPLRDSLAALGEQRARANEDAMTAALDGYLSRFIGVVTSRLSGPKARRGTKFWQGAQGSPPLETKAIDPGYVVPDKLVNEVADVARPVALRIAVDAGADVAHRLGVLPADETGHGMFAVDQQRVDGAVEAAIARILAVAQHHAAEIRKEITGAAATEDGLNEVLDHVREAHRRGASWVRMSGRTLANALANEAAIQQAEALGVTHMQWISKRDDRVRATHRAADGQVRRIDDEFQVGSWFLRFPADPKDLPASWSEVAGCRCSLGFRKPNADTADALRLLGSRAEPGTASPAATRLLAAAAHTAIPSLTGEPGPAPVTLEEPVLAYRTLSSAISAAPGQWLGAGAVLLALTAPSVASAAAPVLAVVIPAGKQVIVTGGAVQLPPGSMLEVVGVTGSAIQARMVA
jgi:hypothetical protein